MFVINKTKKKIIMFLLFLFTISSIPTSAEDTNQVERINTKVKNIPKFKNPVCLLVGLNSSELLYREVATLSGFEFFTVPYKTNVEELKEQINPSQVIIKHPSGFVGLYSPEGDLIRGVQTVNGPQPYTIPGAVPPSIVLPSDANSIFDSIYYPGINTGGVSQGGLGYSPPPRGRNLKRHLLKLSTLLGVTQFQYPGYFMAYPTYNQEKLVPALLFPRIPTAIGAAATFVDAKLDESEYNQARPQPRDYMFQPIIEGY